MRHEYWRCCLSGGVGEIAGYEHPPLYEVNNYQKVITGVEFLVFFSSEKHCFGEIFYQKAGVYSEFLVV